MQIVHEKTSNATQQKLTLVRPRPSLSGLGWSLDAVIGSHIFLQPTNHKTAPKAPPPTTKQVAF